MNSLIFFYPLLAFFVSRLLVVPLNKIGIKYQLVDIPNERKQHKNKKVRLGGVSIFLGFLSTLVFLYIIFNLLPGTEQKSFNFISDPFSKAFILSISAFFFIGLLEDIYSFSPQLRLFVQAIISIFSWTNGLGIYSISIPENGILPFNTFDLPIILSIFITFVWICGITNSINWLDGLDGLASGLCIIILLGLMSISYEAIQGSFLIFYITIIGSCLGFLSYNFYPSSILMGDSGSYFLGSFIGYSTLISCSSNFIDNTFNLASTNIFLALFVLSLPVYDMCYVIYSRLKNRISPFYPDRRHIHHRLLDRGYSHKGSVITIYLINIIIMLTINFIYHNI